MKISKNAPKLRFLVKNDLFGEKWPKNKNFTLNGFSNLFVCVKGCLGDTFPVKTGVAPQITTKHTIWTLWLARES